MIQPKEFVDVLRSSGDASGRRPRFMEVRVCKGARKDLGRPKEPPQANKKLFMEMLTHG